MEIEHFRAGTIIEIAEFRCVPCAAKAHNVTT